MSPSVALTIAGSDSSGGAGIQADLKTMARFGVYGQTTVTCVVAEVPGKVLGIQPVEPKIIADQIQLSLKYFPVAAIKTGMLYSTEIIETICDILESISGDNRPSLVVDPVMVATSGESLLRADAIQSYRRRLIPLATLVTPNLDETAVLVGHAIKTAAELRDAGKALASEFGVSFLLKGGHLRAQNAVDLLIDDKEIEELSAPYVHGVSTHGTGCTYSAAITANLALGRSLRDSIRISKEFISTAIKQSYQWPDGMTALGL